MIRFEYMMAVPAAPFSNVFSSKTLSSEHVVQAVAHVAGGVPPQHAARGVLQVEARLQYTTKDAPSVEVWENVTRER